MSPGTPSSFRTSRRRILRRSLVAVAVAVPGVLLCSPVAAQASGPPALTCSAVSLPVAIADPGPADQTLWGQLCYRGQDEPSTVQILIPGGTYNHLYWDFPDGNGYYNYVGAATGAGYATLDVDPVGQGNSSHPASAEVTLTAEAVEANKDTVTAPLLAGGASLLALPAAEQPTDHISVPVLVVAGQDDHLFCTGVTVYNCASTASVQRFESRYYPAAAHLKVVVIPDTGHALALATTAPATDAVMIGWSLSVLAP